MQVRRLKKDIIKYLKHHRKQRSLGIFTVLVLLALTSTYLVHVYLSFQVKTTFATTVIRIDDVPFYPEPFVFETNGPTYFNSYAKVDYIVASKFGYIFKNCSIFASLDNSTWVEIPLAYNQSDLNIKKPANLGLVKLDNPIVTIYLKTYIPPQIVEYYFNVTKDFIMNNNFSSHIIITPVPSSLDTGKTIFTFLTIFSAIFGVYNFFKSRNREIGDGNKAKVKSAKVKSPLGGLLGCKNPSSTNLKVIVFTGSHSSVGRSKC